MWNSCTNNWYYYQAFLRVVNGFFNCFWYFLVFSSTETNTAISVSNHYYCSKTEATTTFRYSSNPLHPYYTLFKFCVAFVVESFTQVIPSRSIKSRDHLHERHLLILLHVQDFRNRHVQIHQFYGLFQSHVLQQACQLV